MGATSSTGPSRPSHRSTGRKNKLKFSSKFRMVSLDSIFSKLAKVGFYAENVDKIYQTNGSNFMRKISLITLTLLYALCLGCGRTERVPAPDVRTNPAPHERQRLDISITGQSAVIEGMRGRLQYNIADDSCLPVDYGMALGGMKPIFTMDPTLKVAITGHGGYEGFVYRDMYEPSNYYGMGVCRWELTAINIYIVRKDGRKQSFMLNGIDLKYGAQSYVTCPSGSPGQYSLNCAFSRSYPIEIPGDFYTLSINSGRD